MEKKVRLLYLLRYFLDHTDEEHTITNAQIRELMEEAGCPIEIRTVRDDINALNEMGFDIVETYPVAGKAAHYYCGERNFETQELQIIIDAIASAQFIPPEKSRDLIRRLAKQARISERERLIPRVIVGEKIKASCTQIYYILQAVNEAIRQDKQIAFRYFTYNLEKKKVYRNGGEIYALSPYTTVWVNERYYVLGWSEKHAKVVSFRIDRMDLPAIRNIRRIPEPFDFDMQDYCGKITKMYTGHNELVQLRCRHDMVDQLIDKFGYGIAIGNITDETFDTIVEVSASSTFYGWLFQYAGKIRIIAPGNVREEYREMLRNELEDEYLWEK